MDDLCNLVEGMHVGKQHPYFDMAKKDIYKLVQLYSQYQEYDNSSLSLIKNLNLIETDMYQLNLVIQYIITYGYQLCNYYLQSMKVDSYNKNKLIDYLDQYVDELSSIVR